MDELWRIYNHSEYNQPEGQICENIAKHSLFKICLAVPSMLDIEGFTYVHTEIILSSHGNTSFAGDKIVYRLYQYNLLNSEEVIAYFSNGSIDSLITIMNYIANDNIKEINLFLLSIINIYQRTPDKDKINFIDELFSKIKDNMSTPFAIHIIESLQYLFLCQTVSTDDEKMFIHIGRIISFPVKIIKILISNSADIKFFKIAINLALDDGGLWAIGQITLTNCAQHDMNQLIKPLIEVLKERYQEPPITIIFRQSYHSIDNHCLYTALENAGISHKDIYEAARKFNRDNDPGFLKWLEENI